MMTGEGACGVCQYEFKTMMNVHRTARMELVHMNGDNGTDEMMHSPSKGDYGAFNEAAV